MQMTRCLKNKFADTVCGIEKTQTVSGEMK